MEGFGDPARNSIRNNLIACAAGARVLWLEECWTKDPSNSLNRNCYYAAGDGRFRYNDLDRETLAAYQAIGGQDTHSLWADPKLVAPGMSPRGRLPLAEYRLLPGSPCGGAGVDLGDMGPHDYWGNPTASGGRPAIGAHEL